MEILINKTILINALQIINPVTDKSSSKPILSNFLLSSITEDRVEFSATDYEIAIKGNCKAQVKMEGAICVNAKKLLEICSEFMGEEVHLQSDDQQWVKVASGTSVLRLPTMEIGLYPKMEVGDLPQGFSLAPQEFKKAIDRTLFAIQTNETRKTLMGVCLNVGDGAHGVFTATDGHRLAQVKKTIQDPALESPPEIIVPKKALDELSKVLGGLTEPVEVRFDERSLMVTTPGVKLTTRLIEGKYPNVDPIIPKDNDKTVEINRERLTNALKIISLMSNDKIKPVKMSLNGNNLALESEKGEAGEAKDEIPVEYNGEPIQVGFNAKYLLDVLNKVTEGESIRMELKGPLNPCLIRVSGDESFLSVVMPLRIEW
ncbi:MAG: DNA polymerase III subunit beta [Deltaproteobacteria bacterium]|nr:DNA polymerase III subunit beta [Deltaproteobacteria bacterium]